MDAGGQRRDQPTRRLRLRREAHPPSLWKSPRQLRCRSRVGRHVLPTPMPLSRNASRAAVQELTKAYRELTTKNARNLTAAMQALAAVKSPAEFIDTQQRLIKEGVETAISDSQQITQLTTAVFTAAFEPTKKQAEGQHIGRQ